MLNKLNYTQKKGLICGLYKALKKKEQDIKEKGELVGNKKELGGWRHDRAK